MIEFNAIDIVALTVIVGGLILIGLGVNGIVGGLLVSVVAYYFGKRASSLPKQ